jgi:hypothetical protein
MLWCPIVYVYVDFIGRKVCGGGTGLTIPIGVSSGKLCHPLQPRPETPSRPCNIVATQKSAR